MAPPKELVSQLLVQVAKAHRQAVGSALAELGLHVGQELLLMQLWREEGPTQTELVQRLGVEPPTVTKALQRMERAGLVERRSDPSDARVSRVYLTRAGRSLRASVEGVWERVEAQMLEGFTSEERTLLRRLLVALQNNLS